MLDVLVGGVAGQEVRTSWRTKRLRIIPPLWRAGGVVWRCCSARSCVAYCAHATLGEISDPHSLNVGPPTPSNTATLCLTHWHLGMLHGTLVRFGGDSGVGLDPKQRKVRTAGRTPLCPKMSQNAVTRSSERFWICPKLFRIDDIAYPKPSQHTHLQDHSKGTKPPPSKTQKMPRKHCCLPHLSHLPHWRVRNRPPKRCHNPTGVANVCQPCPHTK